MSDLHIVEDTSPQLGGDLDLNGHAIAGATASEIGYLSGVTSAIQTQLDATEKTANKNQPNGYPGLDGNGNLVGTIVPRNGTAAEIEQIVLLAGEVAYCTDTGEIRIGDGSTAGGVSISIGETNLNSGSLNTVNNGGYPYVVAIGSTTDATPTALNLTDYSGDIDNTVVTAVPFPCDANKSYAFLVHLAARKDDGTSAMFLRQAVIKNVSDTVSLEGAVQTVGVDINPANWTVAISADDANKCLQILVTGAEAANIRWVAMVQAVEIGF